MKHVIAFFAAYGFCSFMWTAGRVAAAAIKGALP